MALESANVINVDVKKPLEISATAASNVNQFQIESTLMIRKQ